jgi:hypothetical protein
MAAGHGPKRVDHEMIKEARKIITVCGTDFYPATYPGKVETWSVESLRG